MEQPRLPSITCGAPEIRAHVNNEQWMTEAESTRRQYSEDDRKRQLQVRNTLHCSRQKKETRDSMIDHMGKRDIGREKPAMTHTGL